MSPANNNKSPNSIFRSVSYFSSVDDQSLKEIIQSAIRKQYQAEEIIFFESDPPSGLHIVESGWLKATKTSSEGRDQILATLGPGHVFNATGIFTGAPNPATVSALENAVIWYMPAQVLISLLEKHPEIANAIIFSLASRIQYLVNKVEDLALRSVESRLARYLLEKHETGMVSRERWATQAEIAAQLGTVTDVLNRSLRKFADDGWIRVSRHQIELINIEELKNIAALE